MVLERSQSGIFKMKGPKPMTIVIKLGTSSIVNEVTHEPLLSTLSHIVETVVSLKKDGHKVVLVSSGAIGVALGERKMEKRPKHLPAVQALAAIGQCKLMSIWDKLFALVGQTIAQILITRNDVADKTQYHNAQNTVNELLKMGVVPIVNENDTIAVAEIKFGDNDTLSAITAAMVHADYLFLMTDVDCLYDRNPRTYPDAKAIEVVENIDQLQADVTSKGSSVGTGGMATKIIAARLATSAGVATIITRSSNPGNVVSIVRYLQYLRSQNPDSQSNTPPRNGNGANGAANDKQHDACGDAEGLVQAVSSMRIDPATVPKHTRFLPVNPPIRDRYMWLLHCLSPSGTIYIDSGAHRALLNKNGLLPVGILGVDGTFAQQEAVRLVVVAHSYPNQLSYNGGIEVGRALVNYSSTEIGRIKGLRSNKIMEVLGYAETEYVAFRENISFFKRESRPATPSAPPTPRIEVGALEY